MICKFCRNGNHEKCPNGTWCDCQHKNLIPADDSPPAVDGQAVEEPVAVGDA